MRVDIPQVFNDHVCKAAALLYFDASPEFLHFKTSYPIRIRDPGFSKKKFSTLPDRGVHQFDRIRKMTTSPNYEIILVTWQYAKSFHVSTYESHSLRSRASCCDRVPYDN